MPEVIIAEGRTASSPGAREDGGALLVPLAELQQSTGWTLKPEGLCRDELCVPIPAGERDQWIRGESLDYTRFASFMGQVSAHDAKHRAWSFAQGPGSGRVLSSVEAPDFTLPDADGAPHSLSGYRGRKVFLVSWASW